MGRLTVLALRTCLAVGLAGLLFVQLVMVPLLAVDLSEAGPEVLRVRPAIVVIVLLGLLAIQVTLVCVWKLLSLVRRDAVFAQAAFKYVDVIIAAIAAAALLTFAMGAVLAPGEAVAPGVVLMLGGVGLLIGAVALIVVVMRTLLAQAMTMRQELDEVI
ncbi:DUF2975 domain-containing protein [Arthrobacter glacialis]|uniref:DUF2975 domain-containing protein n=1 Tax=Arthrobacter glacialis TaxID=1664 RepID=A0A2S3ZUR6_ARTGL|nr:DUF2975 domain-containing protein [Arthrobacter glacialis]POH72960.1 DUF2975 domain-containing protein [Arthrobacter glacialis]